MNNKKFAGFSTRDLVYSCINGHDIQVTVLTPEVLQERPPSRYPVLIHWHGGGFITGHRIYAPWWPDWSAHCPFLYPARPLEIKLKSSTRVPVEMLQVPRIRPLPQRPHHQPRPPPPPRSQRHRPPRRRRSLLGLDARRAPLARRPRIMARGPGPRPRRRRRRQLRRLPGHADGPAVPAQSRRQSRHVRLRAAERHQ